ncbi:MAG: 2,3,4,5-tetrahydropyridine-2,6-dicarboxylate N-succinyltransferase [Alphaproteobacteria bacterium]|nr:2,3,4,5-tetrahydropyridine-2,6-dicarboxylate N-succinyltransferase [Alphaproteobacteria bacterium]
MTGDSPRLDAARSVIESAWEARSDSDALGSPDVKDAVSAAIDALDRGEARVASPSPGDGGDATVWTVHDWLKKAVLLSFRLNLNDVIEGGPGVAGAWWDKVPSKFEGWGREAFDAAGFRAVPPCAVRRGAFVARGAVLMPSYVNIGAYVGPGAMIDTWATVGSCAQIGANCHISGGVGIGGVLEPLQAAPVIIEDDVFIGARSEVAEGVIVRRGSVLSMGVYLGASTKIVDRESGEIFYGETPPYSVIVPGAMPSEKGGPNLYCAVIVKRVDERTRSKTSINELLR